MAAKKAAKARVPARRGSSVKTLSKRRAQVKAVSTKRSVKAKIGGGGKLSKPHKPIKPAERAERVQRLVQRVEPTKPAIAEPLFKPTELVGITAEVVGERMPTKKSVEPRLPKPRRQSAGLPIPQATFFF